MKSPKTYALVLLALTTLGGAALSWQQYQELVELRVAALNKGERTDLQKRLADLERRNRELQDQLAAAGDRGDNARAMAAGAPNGQPARGGQFGPGGPGGRGGRGGGPQQQQEAMQALMAKPEVQALMAIQQKARLDAQYAALFKNLNLTPAQADKVKALLAERQATQEDTMNAARDQGLNPRTDRDAFRKLLADAQSSVNDGLKSVLGDAGFSRLQNYEQTMPQRNLVNQLQERLSYSDTPLTPVQADQLVQILASTAPQRPNANGAAPAPDRGGFGGGPGGGPGGGGGFGGGGPGGGGGGGFGGGPGGGGGGGGGGGVTITTAAVSQAQSVLAASQLAALQQLQQQQQAQQQLQQILDTARGPQNGGRGGPNGGGGNGGDTAAAGGRPRG